MKPINPVSRTLETEDGDIDIDLHSDGDLTINDHSGDSILIFADEVKNFAAMLNEVLSDKQQNPIVTLTRDNATTHMASNIIYEQRQTECYGGPSHIVIDQRATDGAVMAQTLIRPEYFDQFIKMLHDAKAQHDAIAARGK